MSDAYKCDRCGELSEYGLELGVGEGSHWGEAQEKDHLCKSCHTDFEGFMVGEQ